jgi:hypothetical protein
MDLFYDTSPRHIYAIAMIELWHDRFSAILVRIVLAEKISMDGGSWICSSLSIFDLNIFVSTEWCGANPPTLTRWCSIVGDFQYLDETFTD